MTSNTPPATNEGDVSELFKSVRYFLIGSLDDEVKKKLTDGQAKAESYLSALVTHVILANNDKCSAEEAIEIFQIPVVSPHWVNWSVECKKLLPTEAFDAYSPQMFHNFVVCFSQLSKKDKETLWTLITVNGGRCLSTLNSSCTHLAVAYPKGKKYEAAIKYGVAAVSPDWFLDSIKKKALQEIEEYKTENVIIPESPKPVEKTPPAVIKVEAKETVADRIIEPTKALSVSGSASATTGGGNDTSASGGVVLATVTITMSTCSQTVSTTTVANSRRPEVSSSSSSALTAAGGSSGIAMSKTTGGVASTVGMSITQAIHLKQQQQQLQQQQRMNNNMKQEQMKHGNMQQQQQMRTTQLKDQQLLHLQKQFPNHQLTINSSQPSQDITSPQYTVNGQGVSQATVIPSSTGISMAAGGGLPINQISMSNVGANQQMQTNQNIKINITPQQQQQGMQMMQISNQNPNATGYTIMTSQSGNIMSQQQQQQQQQPMQVGHHPQAQQQQQRGQQQNFMSPLQQQLMYGNMPMQQQQQQMVQQQQHMMPQGFNNQQQVALQQQQQQQQGNFQLQQQQPDQNLLIQQQQQQQQMVTTNVMTPVQQQQDNKQQQQQVFIDTQMQQQQQLQPQQLQHLQQIQQQQLMQQQQPAGMYLHNPQQHLMQTTGQPHQHPGVHPQQQQQVNVVTATGDGSTPNPQMFQQQTAMTHPNMQEQQHPVLFQQQQQQQPQQGAAISRLPSSTSLKAAGMAGISPIALQQGLLNAAQMKPDQPALVHPSLQGELFPKSEFFGRSSKITGATANGGPNQKKKSRSRKKTTDATTASNPEEVKPRAKPRTNNRKKSTKSATSSATVTTIQPQMYNGPNRPSVVHHMGAQRFPIQHPTNQQDQQQVVQQQQYFQQTNNYQTHEQIMQQQQQQQRLVTQQQQQQQQQQIQQIQQQQRMKQLTLVQQQQQPATTQQLMHHQQQQLFQQNGGITFKQLPPQQPQIVRAKSAAGVVQGVGGPTPSKQPRMASPAASRRPSANKGNAMRDTVVKAQQELIRHKRDEENKRDQLRREQHLGKFVDPLTISVPQMKEDVYVTRQASFKVPTDLCLLGCVFVVDEYDDILPVNESKMMFKTILPKFGGVLLEKENIEGSSYTHLICATQKSTLYQKATNEGKRCATIYWLHDVICNRHIRAPWLAAHLPVPYPWNIRPATKHIVTTSGFHQKERELVKVMLHISGARFSSCMNRNCTIVICKRPTGAKYTKANEWKIPCVNMMWLRDILHTETPTPLQPDNDAYKRFPDSEFEKVTEAGFLLDFPRVASLLEPWKVGVQITDETLAKSYVRKSVTVQQASIQLQPTCDIPITSYRSLPRIVFTGFSPREVADMKKKLGSIPGLRFTDRPDLSTHLIAKSVLRTQKFLACLCAGSYILTQKWVDNSVASNHPLDENDYILVDKKCEERLKISLKENIRRAKSKKIFLNCMFFVTSKVQPDHNTLKTIITCGGGSVIHKLPSASDLKHLQSRTSSNRNDRYFVVSCTADQDVYEPLKKEGVIIHNAEVVLTSALKQRIDDEMNRL